MKKMSTNVLSMPAPIWAVKTAPSVSINLGRIAVSVNRVGLASIVRNAKAIAYSHRPGNCVVMVLALAAMIPSAINVYVIRVGRPRAYRPPAPWMWMNVRKVIHLV